MFKNFVLVVAVIAIVSFSGKVFADFEVHMVDALGKNQIADFRDDGDFQLSETPYLYFQIPDFDPNMQGISFGGSYWLDPEDAIFSTVPVTPNSNGEVWLTLDWNSVTKTTGIWNVSGWYSKPFTQTQNDMTTFNYVPEPVSTTLFLLGGATLAVRRMRRK